MIAEISHLTMVKMVTLCHLGFLKTEFFGTAGKLWRTNMCDRTKFQQNQPDGFGRYRKFSIFKMATIRHVGFWKFKFLVNRHIVGLMFIAIPNFTKISKTVAEISHLTIFKMAAVRHLGFLKVWVFDQMVSSGGIICAILQNSVKIGQMVAVISWVFDFQYDCHLPSWILIFLNFCLTAHWEA